MKKDLILYLIILATFVFILDGTTYASVLFDFEGAPYLAGSAQIEAYMEGLYPGDITVKNAMIERFTNPLGFDKFIRNSNIVGFDWFSITFEDPYPITSVSFDWGVFSNPIHVYRDEQTADNLIFSSSWYAWKSGTFTKTFFDSVNTLIFTDSGLGDIAIDNLEVAPMPEPASMLLFGIGMLGFRVFRRRK